VSVFVPVLVLQWNSWSHIRCLDLGTGTKGRVEPGLKSFSVLVLRRLTIDPNKLYGRLWRLWNFRAIRQKAIFSRATYIFRTYLMQTNLSKQPCKLLIWTTGYRSKRHKVITTEEVGGGICKSLIRNGWLSVKLPNLLMSFGSSSYDEDYKFAWFVQWKDWFAPDTLPANSPCICMGTYLAQINISMQPYKHLI
jgi:hypothetical protein